MIVLDSSAALELVLDTEHASFVADTLREHELAIAPHLLDAEVASALRRLAVTGAVTEQRCVVALAHFAALRLVRFGMLRSLPRMWELRETVTTADAFFVALAEDTGAPLLTTDRRLGRAHGHTATIVTP